MVPTSTTIVATAGGVLALLAALLLVKVPIAYNLRNLVVRWRTTLMTSLAFTLVVALLVVMLAFVRGMQRLSDQSGQPGNVIVLSEGATDEQFSNLGFGDSQDVERQPGVLRNADGQPLSSREIYVVVTQPIPAQPGERRRRRFVQVRGIEVPEIAGQVHGLDLYEGGQWFSVAGVQAAGGDAANDQQLIQAVVGEGAAKEFGRDQGKPRLDVGDTFELGPRRWIVVGVMRSAGSTFDSEVWAKRELVGPMFGKEGYSSMVLRTADAAGAAELARYLKEDYKKAALNAMPEIDYFASLSATNQQFLVAIVFITCVMAVGGVFGVMNTMFAAVSQRIKDIGVLRVIGFSRRQLLLSLLVESLVIAAVGGALGCFIGWFADGWTATSILASGRGAGKTVVLQLTVDAEIIAAGLLLTLAMGCLGGLLPALAAMRTRPLEALR